MTDENIPSINLDSAEDVKKVKGFSPYQPFFVKDEKGQRFDYYSFLSVKQESYLPIWIVKEDIAKEFYVARGFSSVNIEVISLGALSFAEASSWREDHPVIKRISTAILLRRLKQNFETDQTTSGLRLSGISFPFLGEVGISSEDDSIF